MSRRGPFRYVPEDRLSNRDRWWKPWVHKRQEPIDPKTMRHTWWWQSYRNQYVDLTEPRPDGRTVLGDRVERSRDRKLRHKARQSKEAR